VATEVLGMMGRGDKWYIERGEEQEAKKTKMKKGTGGGT